ncbi:MAG: hypothetical protein SF066_09845 [Thermoanaerobaculia bacterium]|nr:hypothetical protein [Thermoanaerobaculia bacterium]
MHNVRRILFAALLLVPCVAMAADSVAPAPAEPDFFLTASETVEPLQSEVPAVDSLPTLDLELGLPAPFLAACTITDYCASCSRGLKFCRRTCCNGSCSTSCGVCGAC